MNFLFCRAEPDGIKMRDSVTRGKREGNAAFLKKGLAKNFPHGLITNKVQQKHQDYGVHSPTDEGDAAFLKKGLAKNFPHGLITNKVQ